MTVRIDLGGGFSVEPVEYQGDDPVRIVGFIERHPRPDTGEECRGFLWIDGTSEAHVDGPVWECLSMDPLTLRPSILCRACHQHYFIQQGKVVLT